MDQPCRVRHVAQAAYGADNQACGAAQSTLLALTWRGRWLVQAHAAPGSPVLCVWLQAFRFSELLRRRTSAACARPCGVKRGGHGGASAIKRGIRISSASAAAPGRRRGCYCARQVMRRGGRSGPGFLRRLRSKTFPVGGHLVVGIVRPLNFGDL